MRFEMINALIGDSVKKAANQLKSVGARLRQVMAVGMLTAMVAFTIHPSPAHSATVGQPNGTLSEAVNDLNVKVLGGWVSVSRSWLVDSVITGGGKWYFNTGWADLRFTLDSLDGSVKSINRLEAVFSKGGNNIYIFDKTAFIKPITAPNPAYPNDPTKTIITSWRWGSAGVAADAKLTHLPEFC